MRSLLLSLLLFPALAMAQNEAPLSLDQAEKLWQAHSREISLARTAVGGAAADLKTAGQIPNPDVSLNTLSISPWSGYGSGGWKDKKMDTQLRLDQTIERGGKRELRVKGAEARLEAARFDLDDTARQQRGALRYAYYNLRLAQEKLLLAKETAELYGKSSDAGRLRLKAGDIAPIDLSRLQIDKSRADSEARQAQAELEQAQLELAYLIGRDPETLYAADPWPALEEQALTQTPLDQRPDLEAARKRVAAAETDRDLARALKKRNVTLGVQYEHNLQNAPTNSYGIGFSVPLFAWHEYEGEIARAEADYDNARQQFERQQAQATGQVAQARSTLLSAQARYKRLEGGLLADAERVAKAAEFAYSKGAMGLMDLLDARRTLRQIQMEAASARADYAKALSDWQIQAEFRKNK
ncbi:TolC family protein [Dechloromonas sp. TW-R-39-2]|uniref:TolC family protein n=1 Tax=Dechloromonas sp. TW-R-39-2 TaxID=2654218 RepID=UPI00193DCC59|nr:TolC family protein [Dechloromonas sp. TW-R-39-2]QRM19869.1 TolC family protein [Dechloromonas sp. TW-R-39-2]